MRVWTAAVLTALLTAGCTGEPDGGTVDSAGASSSVRPVPGAQSASPTSTQTPEPRKSRQPGPPPRRKALHGHGDGESVRPPVLPQGLPEAIDGAKSPPAGDPAALRALYNLREFARSDVRPLTNPRVWKKLEKAHGAIVRDAVTGELHGTELAADVRRYAELVERAAAASGLL